MSDKNMIGFEQGEKMPEILGMGPIPHIPGNIRTQIVCLNDFTFLLNLQGDWTKEELKDFKGNVTLDIAEIGNVMDIILSFDGSYYEFGYHAANTAPEIEFHHLGEGQAMAFFIVITSQDSTILDHRIISLLSDKQSDAFIDLLNEQREKNLSKEEFNREYDKLMNEMSIEEIKSNAFIHCDYNKYSMLNKTNKIAR